jgi:hypothetical protein
VENQNPEGKLKKKNDFFENPYVKSKNKSKIELN